jgi:hypothetical protein
MSTDHCSRGSVEECAESGTGGKKRREEKERRVAQE